MLGSRRQNVYRQNISLHIRVATMQAPRFRPPSIWDMSKTSWASVGAAALFVIVALREWSYRSGHPHAHGVSGELILLGVAGTVVSIAAAASTIAGEAAREQAARECVPDLSQPLDELKETTALLTDELTNHETLLQQLFEPSEWQGWQEIFHPADEDNGEEENSERR
jgi:hypothetical protein